MSARFSGGEAWETSQFGGGQDLYGEFKRAHETGHFALFYRSHEERLDTAATFLKLGLEANERCLYIADGSSPDEVYDGLESLGVDLETVRGGDQLRVVSAAETYVADGFDPGETTQSLTAMATESRDDGFDGLRVTGETGGLYRGDVSSAELLEYESERERRLHDGGLTVLCQYDLRRLDDAGVADVLQVHPKVVYRRRVCKNPYYRDPGERERSGKTGVPPDELLETLFRLATANDAIRLREQRVSVLNRVLRHNLRNEMSVVQSHAELLEETVSTESRESVEAILAATSRLMEISEDAKRIEQSVGRDVERVPVDLISVLEEAREQVQRQYPNVAISIPNRESLWAEASEELDFALVELFRTLAAMADGDARFDVVFDEECSGRTSRCLRVYCRNTALPDAEIEALTRGHETQLSHGSGLGLWLVNWIVELSGGDLRFGKADAATDEIVIRFVGA
jgi:signal transduction histidine kinase